MAVFDLIVLLAIFYTVYKTLDRFAEWQYRGKLLDKDREIGDNGVDGEGR